MIRKITKLLDSTLAWARCLFWADLNWKRFINGQRLPQDAGLGPEVWHYFALAAQWFASEYVVLEGWNAKEFKDERIDELRRHIPSDLLKKFRNAVFHCPPSVYETRFLDLLDQSRD